MQAGLSIHYPLTTIHCFYTLRRLGGRQPLCGTGVTSLMVRTSRPAAESARTADSRPDPGPLTRKRRSLARTTEAQRTRTLPRHRVSRGIGDGDNGVVEGRLNVHQPVRNVLALLLLELLGLAFLVRSGGSRCFGHELCLPRCFLLVRYRALTRTLAGAGVGVGALPADGQAAAMTIPTIRTDLDEPLDVHRDVFAQIAFDVAALLDDLTDAVDLVFIEVAHLLGGLHIGRAENALRARIPDAENVRQRDNDVLVARKIHACNTCHSCSESVDSG